MDISNLNKQFNLDYARYHSLISEITRGDLSVEENIKQISFYDVMKFNRLISLNDILLFGRSSIINNGLDILDVAKDSTIALIIKYWNPLVRICYDYVYNRDFQAHVAYSTEYNLIFIPTKINKVYTLVDNRNNIIYINDIYDREIKCIDRDANKVSRYML